MDEARARPPRAGSPNTGAEETRPHPPRRRRRRRFSAQLRRTHAIHQAKRIVAVIGLGLLVVAASTYLAKRFADMKVAVPNVGQSGN